MPTANEIVIIAFAVTNSLRVMAYVPQILRLVRDNSGAASVSCCTWFLFFMSNISTALYAAMVLDDPQMSAIFVANAICSGAILILAIVRKRRLHPRAEQQLAEPTNKVQFIYPAYSEQR